MFSELFYRIFTDFYTILIRKNQLNLLNLCPKQIQNFNLLNIVGLCNLDEFELLRSFSLSDNEKNAILWSVKESISKILKTGFTLELDFFSIDSIVYTKDIYYGTFKNFPQYKFNTFIVGGFVFSFVFPKQSTVEIKALYRKLFYNRYMFKD